MEALTIRLCRIASVTGGAGEAAVVAALAEHIRRTDQRSRLDVRTVVSDHDRLHRPNLICHLAGTNRQLVVLLGHVDTVGTADYGALRPLATDPLALTERIAKGAMGGAMAELAQGGEWLFGRGVLDMKSGLAVAAGVLLRRARDQVSGPHLLFAACADEEATSLGARTVGPWIARFCSERGLQLAGVIKTDFTAHVAEGQPRRIYSASVGKVLLGVSVFGVVSHAGEPEAGLDPNRLLAGITTALTYRPHLADRTADGETAPLVVTLSQSDYKQRYDVQTPIAAHALYNLLQVRSAPSERLQTMLAEIRQAVAAQEAEMRGLSRGWPVSVCTWSELWQAASGAVCRSLERQAARLAGQQPHQLNRRLVERLVALTGTAPTVVVYVAAPPIPRVTSTPALSHRLDGLAAQGQPVVNAGHFPFISDLSFMVDSPDQRDRKVLADLPQLLGKTPDPPVLAPGEVILAGPCGDGAHRADERLERRYTFSVLPGLVESLVDRLAADGS